MIVHADVGQPIGLFSKRNAHAVTLTDARKPCRQFGMGRAPVAFGLAQVQVDQCACKCQIGQRDGYALTPFMFAELAGNIFKCAGQ